MTAKVAGLAFLAALVMLAPLATAEADSGNTASPERPDDAAWVEDCPPDMMCAASDVEEDSEDNVTRGEDCEFCRYDEGEECIHCTGAPAEDNTTWGTDCPPGMYCMSDGTPDDAGWVDCGGEVCAYDTPHDPAEPASAESAEASGPAAFALAGVLGVVALALAAALRKQ